MADSAPAGGTRVIYALQRAFAAVEARKVEVLAQVDMLPAHYALMMNIRAHPGVTGAELSRLLGVTPQNVASLVARLVERGWIERRSHGRHAHILELHLTAPGTELLGRADRLIAGLERQVVRALGSPDTEALKTGLEALRVSVSDR